MTTLESKTVLIPHPRNLVFDYLGDFRNFGNMMPSDKISDWQATEDNCSFRIIGMADITLQFQEKNPPSTLRITSAGKTPIKFTMSILLDEVAEGTNGRIVMDADLNPMLKIMAEKPLQNFLNMLADRMPGLPIQST